LKEKTSKREAKLRKEIEDKKAEKRELKKVKKEAFRAIGATYIEPLSSRPPLVF
jgi:hypothetical protein